MSEIKYTTDGKKVVIIGNLNAQEKIVQEIFIINGNEVPSGQNFVVKDLHDAPAISWKEKNIKEIELRYEKEYKQKLDELDVLNKKHRQVCLEFRNKISYIANAVQKIQPSTFDLLADYITGEIRFIVINNYDLEIKDIKDFNQNYKEKLRLISFFGTDDGSFTYAIGDYYDYSGGHKKFIPCKTKDEAIEIVKNILLAKETIYENDIKIANKYNIKLDKNKIKAYKEGTLINLNKNLQRQKEELEKTKSKIKELNEL